MGYPLLSRSLTRLSGVCKPLQDVVKTAAELTTVEFFVVEGVRTLARQKELYAQGRTAPGKIVTWTMKSKHIDGLAVDLVPVKDGALQWNDVAAFKAIGAAMFEAAKVHGVKIRWGYDWDMDGVLQEKGEYDGPHFEIV